MKMNTSKTLFITTTMLSTTMVMSSNNMLFSWMSLEINFISFIPVMSKSKKICDQTMKYLIIQSTSSSMMLMAMLMNSTIESPLNSSIILMASMLMKLGMMPFHLWLPSLMQNLSWNTCLILSTWQKIAPTILMSQMISLNILKPMMIINLLMSSIIGLKQSSTKKIMAYSSISNSPWMIMATKFSKFQFLYFIMTYTTLMTMMMMTMKKNKMLFLNQIKSTNPQQKIVLITLILSMSGMPPMLGFFPKWMILQTSMNSSMMIASMMIVSSMISTFMYMKMIYPTITNFSMNKKNNTIQKEMSFTLMINMMGIPLALIMKTN